MKKITWIIFIIIFLFVNLISTVSYAEDGESVPAGTETGENAEGTSGFFTKEEEDMMGMDTFVKDMDKGETSLNLNGQSKNVSTILNTTTNGGVGSLVIRILNFIPLLANEALTGVMKTIENNDEMLYFTIYDTVMGNYTIFNFDFAENDNQYNNAKPGEGAYSKKISQKTKGIYKTMRELSIAASLFVLIYIGIRMAISTVASQKAKYKDMLVNWAISFALLFVLHYIIVILSQFSIVMLNIIQDFAGKNNINQVEIGIIMGLMKDLSGKSGYNLVTTTLTIGYLTYIQIKFFLLYAKRACEIIFLTSIAPLVTITYSIDKAGDGKAQAFGALVKELTMKVAIQIVHAMAYVLFMMCAAAIAQKAPLVALVFFSGLSRGEKILSNLLNVKSESFEDEKVPVID